MCLGSRDIIKQRRKNEEIRMLGAGLVPHREVALAYRVDIRIITRDSFS